VKSSHTFWLSVRWDLQAVWKAAHRQLSLQSARQLAQGQVGIKQADLDAIMSPAAPRHEALAAKSTTSNMSVDDADAKSNQRVRYSELVSKILSGTATEAEQNEAELIGTSHLRMLCA
jgi:hypothetical protein